MLDFTRSGLPNVSQSKSKFTTFLWSDNCSLFTDYTNLHLSLNMLHLDNSIMIFHMKCIVRYMVLSVLSKYWFRTLVRRKHFCTKLGCVKQALHGFLEFELFKTRSNNYWNLWKTNNFALLHQHVCNKYLQHLATSSTRHSFASH